MRVDVYYNLHKHLWSVRDKKTGRVILHCNRVDLVDVTFHVGQKGKERVREEQRKNVHAYVTGILTNWDSGTITEAGASLEALEQTHQRARHTVYPVLGRPEVTYNPYLYDSFVLKASTETAVTKAVAVTMQYKKVFLGAIPYALMNKKDLPWAM